MLINSKTDIGLERKTNQDAFFCCEMPDKSVLAIVCDGMGGANAGNVASETAVKGITKYIINSYRANMDTSSIERMIKNAIYSANIEIYDMALKNPEFAGMGTTAVITIAKEDEAIIAYVGDSRAYKVSNEIVQLTKDHSVVQSLIEENKLNPDEARFHPRKNVITRAIGVEENIAVDFVNTSFDKEEKLLLCTDGLSSLVTSEEMQEIFRKYTGKEAIEKLIELANKHGGKDNITAVVIEA